MAITKLNLTSSLVTSEYQCTTTDDSSVYPTDCEIGSTMIVIDKTAKKVDHFKYFDGEEWVVL